MRIEQTCPCGARISVVFRVSSLEREELAKAAEVLNSWREEHMACPRRVA